MTLHNKINLKGFVGFCLVQGDTSYEAKKLHLYCTIKDIPLLRVASGEVCPKAFVPCGGVEWCIKSLGVNVEPDYYPIWLQDYLHRKVWKSNDWIIGKKLFVKPADKYKRFTGFITNGFYSKKKKPPFWYSEIMHIVNEWRYYISNGVILCGSWYHGEYLSEPIAPKININIPEGFCGAIDFGETSTGHIVLIESQHPFACGWYGNDDALYFQWLVDGWKYMQDNNNHV